MAPVQDIQLATRSSGRKHKRISLYSRTNDVLYLHIYTLLVFAFHGVEMREISYANGRFLLRRGLQNHLIDDWQEMNDISVPENRILNTVFNSKFYTYCIIETCKVNA